MATETETVVRRTEAIEEETRENNVEEKADSEESSTGCFRARRKKKGPKSRRPPRKSTTYTRLTSTVVELKCLLNHCRLSGAVVRIFSCREQVVAAADSSVSTGLHCQTCFCVVSDSGHSVPRTWNSVCRCCSQGIFHPHSHPLSIHPPSPTPFLIRYMYNLVHVHVHVCFSSILSLSLSLPLLLSPSPPLPSSR